jgi:methionine-gamma-lyase
MVEHNYHKDRNTNRRLHPETLMMGYGYAPGLSEGSLKSPIFLASTFVFENAQQGKDFFDLTSGRRQPRPGKNRIWFTRASTTPTSKSLKIG